MDSSHTAAKLMQYPLSSKNPQAAQAGAKPVLLRLTKVETIQNAVQKRKACHGF